MQNGRDASRRHEIDDVRVKIDSERVAVNS